MQYKKPQQKTGIRWSNRTWNPVQGCSKVSAGCLNCYAEDLSLRYRWTPKPWAERFAELNVTLRPDRLDAPLSWSTTPSRCFVNSMSDLHHRLVPDAYLDEVYARMALTAHVTYQILTKRPERQRAYLSDPTVADRVLTRADEVLAGLSKRQLARVNRDPADRWPLRNVWIGTSVEDHRVVKRIDELAATPAAVRFLSVEPMIGPLWPEIVDRSDMFARAVLGGMAWVIVGGESGPKRRPFDHAWARQVRDAAVDEGAAFYMKQDAGHRTELRPYLVEADGTRTVWEQYPDDMAPPWTIPADVEIPDAKALTAYLARLTPTSSDQLDLLLR